MMMFYLINTLVAMLIGLGLSNLLQPGKGASLVEPGTATPTLANKTATENFSWTLIPRSIGEPLHPEPSRPVEVLAHTGPGHRPGENQGQPAGSGGEKSFSVVVDSAHDRL